MSKPKSKTQMLIDTIRNSNLGKNDYAKLANVSWDPRDLCSRDLYLRAFAEHERTLKKKTHGEELLEGYEILNDGKGNVSYRRRGGDGMRRFIHMKGDKWLGVIRNPHRIEDMTVLTAKPQYAAAMIEDSLIPAYDRAFGLPMPPGLVNVLGANGKDPASNHPRQ